MKKYVFVFLAVVSLAMSKPQTADIKISGTVYSQSDGHGLPGVNIIVKGTSTGAISNLNGYYALEVPSTKSVLVFTSLGFERKEIVVGFKTTIDAHLVEEVQLSEEVAVTGEATRTERKALSSSVQTAKGKRQKSMKAAADASYGFLRAPYHYERPQRQHNTEAYAAVHENTFLAPKQHPLSTFSIDVDAASYSNVRRFLNQSQRPPKDAVRIEEMVNYFSYDYPQPKGGDPFSVTTEVSQAPWNKEHRLLHIGLQGKQIPTENLPPSNLVFLIDVSGSMNNQNKLPLLKSAFKLLAKQLRAQDKVAMVVYAGAAGVVLPPTEGDQSELIMAALDKLQAGGSTAGGAGIKLAYQLAEKNFVRDGNNRVILATDGDFNVGASSDAQMERLIEIKRKSGVFLTVLGFGMGNYKDSKMEVLADKGNGNYAYIDNILEAKKVLVNEFGGTLFTIAKDVKLQIEFNPAKVKAYRLLGYENRLLADEDFNDDKKDAGELGSGHTVTALYEIIPADGSATDNEVRSVDDLKYQSSTVDPKAYRSTDLMTLKLRYKSTSGSKSQLIEHVVKDQQIPLSKTSDNFRFSAAVASFGMLLRDSEFKGQANFQQVVAMARDAKGTDREGYRAEFIRLVESSDLLAQK
ncbi:MAG: YfbK domain-containing protein [Cyclobacteriaceae bacterium]